MQIYNLIKEEYRKIIQEEITSGSIIVYHRTKIKGKSVINDVVPIKSIAADGFRVGKGNFYGAGVYTTYDLESQLKPNMIETYGPIIIESKVLSLDKFLIFDYDIAKKIYGNKNYRLDRQLELILGKKEWNKYKNDKYLNQLIVNLDYEDKSSVIAKDFYENFSETIINNIKGLIFTGETDGRVLLTYDRKNIEPLRYSTDEGKTWINILDKNIYKRQKEYKPEKEDSRYHHALNAIEINVYNPETSKYIVDNIEKFINKINNYNLNNILYFTEKKDYLINLLLNNDKFINEINYFGILPLVGYSSNPQKIFDELGDSGVKFIDYLQHNQVEKLLRYSPKKEEIISILLNNNKFISNLNSIGIYTLLKNTSNPDYIIDKLINNSNFEINFGSLNLDYLFEYSSKPEKIVNKFENEFKEYISNLSIDRIDTLINRSLLPNKVKFLIKKYNTNIK